VRQTTGLVLTFSLLWTLPPPFCLPGVSFPLPLSSRLRSSPFPSVFFPNRFGPHCKSPGRRWYIFLLIIRWCCFSLTLLPAINPLAADFFSLTPPSFSCFAPPRHFCLATPRNQTNKFLPMSPSLCSSSPFAFFFPLETPPPLPRPFKLVRGDVRRSLFSCQGPPPILSHTIVLLFWQTIGRFSSSLFHTGAFTPSPPFDRTKSALLGAAGLPANNAWFWTPYPHLWTL